MSEFKGTPGPWEYDVKSAEFGPTDKYSPIGQIYKDDEYGFLVAAAPELLEALSKVISEMDEWTWTKWNEEGFKEGTIPQARAAIAKALGETK